MFNMSPEQQITPNILSICIQPDEGIHLKFETKVPDPVQETRSVNMEFHYHNSFKSTALPEAYERLLLDALHGDASLFTRSDGIETAWRLIDPVMAGWAGQDIPSLASYEPGSWGPAESNELLARDSRMWRLGCGGHE
jgi:glucose-6-phosphate 1-dehydrogenase